jgi:nitrogenase molybdenum-cofactor synthesis protein NifE
MAENESGSRSSFLMSFVKMYGTLPLHGITAIPGKISGALLLTDAIEDAVPLIHGPVGCAFQRKVNPFKPHSPFYTTPCTNLNDTDVVYGGEEKLEQGIKETYERYHPNLIMVITTCPSDLIGDDVEAVVRDVSYEVGCDVVYSTGDFVGRSKPVGYQDAFYAIADQMLCNGTDGTGNGDPVHNEGSVNIVTFPIHGAGIKVAEMVSVLGDMEIGVNKVCFDHTRVEDLYDLPKADLNITDYPMSWAKLMEERSEVRSYEILGWTRYSGEKDPELFSPYGIGGSSRVFMEIADMMGKDGVAEEVITRRRKEAEERLSTARKGLDGIKVAAVGGLHGVGLNLFKEAGVDVSVLICRTQILESRLTEEAIKEIVDMNINLADICGFDPEALVNPTIEEEIHAIKSSGTDLVVAPSTSAHLYNREGIRTFDPTSFMIHHQRIGFECPIELCQMLKGALKTPQRRTPLLSMLEHDSQMHGLTPHWAKLSRTFSLLRADTIGDLVNRGVGKGEEVSAT